MSAHPPDLRALGARRSGREDVWGVGDDVSDRSWSQLGHDLQAVPVVERHEIVLVVRGHVIAPSWWHGQTGARQNESPPNCRPG